MVKAVRDPAHRKLYEDIKAFLHEARNAVVRNINTAMVMTYFEIGRMIVVDEQQGKKRAGYAEETLKKLSIDLTKDFGKGFSERNLENMRKFYLLYSIKISQTVSAKSGIVSRISQKNFTLSWSHYLILIRMENEDERRFYEIEAANQNWSIRELERQFNSSLYERLVLSRDKKKIRDLSKKGQTLIRFRDRRGFW